MELRLLQKINDEAKKLSKSFQGIELDAKGSDCHSKKTVRIKITKDNYNLLKERYIVTAKGNVLLTDETKDTFMDKTVNLRSPMFCKSKTGICNVCAGELYYKLGIKNVGLILNLVGGALVTLSLKSFHNLSVSLNSIDIDKFIDQRKY